MFNFFSKRDRGDEIEDNEVLASITYMVKRNESGALIDVALSDYEEDSTNALCSLLEVLGNEAFYVDTISMIKNSLAQEGRNDILIKVFANIESSLRKKFINSAKEKFQSEPYIKPSDMFR